MFNVYADDYRITIDEIPLGNQGENEARCLIIDATAVVNEFGAGGTLTVSNQRKGDALPYPVTNYAMITSTGEAGETLYYIRWILTNVDTAKAGSGYMQATYKIDDVVCKTWIYKYFILPSQGITGDVPEPYEDLLDRMEEIQAETEEAASEAATSAEAAAASAAEAAGYIEGSDVTDAVRWDVTQSLSVSEKGRARANINAANAILETVSGSVASFADGAEATPMVSVVASIEPKQAGSGDPAPDNVRAISGWDSVNVVRSGVNIFDKTKFSTSSVAEITQTENGFIAKTLVAGTYRSARSFRIDGDFAGKTIYLKGNVVDSGSNNGQVDVRFYNADGQEINALYRVFIRSDKTSDSKAVLQETSYLMVYCYSSYNNQSDVGDTSSFSDVIVSVDDVAYAPYNGQTYPTTLPQTVYGGSLDLVSGVLTITHGIIVDTDASHYVRNNATNYYLSGSAIPGIKNNPVGSAPEPSIMSNYFSPAVSAGLGVCFLNPGGVIRFNVHNSEGYASIEDMLTAYPNIQFLYPLETPQTIQLTPTEVDSLLGDNNVWADSGSVSVTYRADLKTYIDNRIETLTNAIISLGGTV